MSNHLIHFLSGLRNCPMLVALLLGLTALLGVAPPAVAQTLSNLELVAIYKVVPDTPLVIRHTRTNQPLLDYSNPDSLNFVYFSPSELADTTTSQSVTITSPSWARHHFCANQDVRSLTRQELKCRQIRWGDDERIPIVSVTTIESVTLNQHEITNGGVVWHVSDNSRSNGAKWIPIPKLSPVTLNPAFPSSQITYSGEIPSNANSLRIIPTASSDTVRVRVNNGSNTSNTKVASEDTLVVSSLDDKDNDVTVSITVTAGGGLTTNYTVTLERNAVPSFGMATVADKTFTSGYSIDPFQVPAASGGDAPLTYSVIDSVIESETDWLPALPAGLTFDVDGTKGCGTALQICGTPTLRAESSNVTIEAKDSNGDAANLSFFINIVGVSIKTDPTPLTESNLDGAKITLRLKPESLTRFVRRVKLSDFELDTKIENVSISGFSEPPGNSDQAVLILSFSGDSNFTTDQTLAVKVKAARYKVNVAGYDTSHALTTATIKVMSDEDQTPTFGTATVRDTTYTVEVVVSDTLPAATGGDGTLTYTLTPGLPGGLTYTAATSGNGGVIAGRPTTATPASTYTLTATDSDGDTATLTFTIAVRNQPAGKPSVRKKDWGTPHTITVSWDTVTHATGYKVQWKSGTETYSTTRQDTTRDTTYTIPDLKAGTPYTVRVIATRTNADDSKPSDEETVTTTSLDIDGNGEVELFEDIIIIIRYDISVRGPSLISGSIDTLRATRTTPKEIEAYLQSLYPALDIDGNGEVELFEDIIIIIRYDISVRGPSLISGSIAEGATRTTPQEIEAYLQSLYPSGSSRQGSSTGDDVSISDVFSSKAAISMDAAETTYTLRALAADGDLTSLLFALGVLLPTSDFDGDGQVTFVDFLTFVGKFGTRRGEERYDARCDLNGDGEIGFDDFLIFADSFDSAN